MDASEISSFDEHIKAELIADLSNIGMPPTPLNEVINVCTGATTSKGHALINIVATEQSTNNLRATR